MRGEYARAVTEGCGPFAMGGDVVTAWDEAGVWRFEGVAATGLVDRQGERLTAAALGSMARQQAVELRSGHRAGKIGVVDECWVKGDEVWVRGRLEGQSAEAARLYTRLKRGEKLALSVGGKVTGARWAWDEAAGKAVRLIEDVELAHVAVCRPEEAVNPGTWVGAAVPSPPAPLPQTADGLEGEGSPATSPALKYRSGGERPSGTRGDGEERPSPPAALLQTADGLEGEGSRSEARALGDTSPLPLGCDREGGLEDGAGIAPGQALKYRSGGERPCGTRGDGEERPSPPAALLQTADGLEGDGSRSEARAMGDTSPLPLGWEPEGGVEDGAGIAPGPALKYRSGGERPCGTRGDGGEDDAGEAPSAPVPLPEASGGLEGEKNGNGIHGIDGTISPHPRPSPAEDLGGGENDHGGDDGDGEDGGDGEVVGAAEVVGVVHEAVTRGEPQGLSGHCARPVRAARIWEGVL